MVITNIIKDLLVYCVVYIPPLIIFIKISAQMKRNKFVLIFISLVYMGLCVFTQNLFPFLFVMFDIYYLTNIEDRKYFNFKTFKITSAFKFTMISYIGTIFISYFWMMISSSKNVSLNEQPVITWMMSMSLMQFILVIPVAVVFAPVVEEFVFRWVLFEKIFNKKIPVIFSAVLTSLIFASMHFSLKAFPILCWIGLYNCYLIHKKSFWYAVFNHSFFNSITTLILLFYKLGIIKIIN